MVPADVTELFRESYHQTPDVVASAPGRVNLIGEHTDYNGGEVLPIAIEQRTCVAMRKLASGHRSRAVSSTEEDTGEFDASDPVRSGRWWGYISGFARYWSPLPPVQIAVTSEVPAGAGLSPQPHWRSPRDLHLPHLQANRNPCATSRSMPGALRPGSFSS